MCMVGRTVLIQGEARKNKSYRKKFFVLSIGQNYTSPRLDYFSNIDKWNQYKDEIQDDISDSLSFRSIDLSNLFFVDDTHRSKPKHGGLDLYMEDRHVVIILSSDELKRKWKEHFDNVIYKNGKVKCYPKIEHTFQVGLRIKPKENMDKAKLLQCKGDFRVCFMKTSMIFLNKSLEIPDFTIQYPFIRQWESRSDGTFRLEIGRAAQFGECSLILQLSDYEESKAAHSMLTNCINIFKLSRPEPPRLRSSGDKSSDRNSSISFSRKSSLGRMNSVGGASKSDSCMGFPRESYSLITSQIESVDIVQDENESNYMPMTITAEEDSKKKMSLNVQNYLEHISRIFRCPCCGYFTKVVTFCSRCTNSSSVNSLQMMLCKAEPLPTVLRTQMQPSIRGKAQSLTERPHLQSLSSSVLRTPAQKQLFSPPDPHKSSQLSQKSQSSDSKTSTNEMSSSSKLESQNSLSISANRHDDEIFMELDFDNLQSSNDSVIGSLSSTNQKSLLSSSQLNCGKCGAGLVHRTHAELLVDHRCSKCSEDMVSLTMVIEEDGGLCNNNCDWIPHTTSLVPSPRPSTVLTACNSDYVEVNHNDQSCS